MLSDRSQAWKTGSEKELILTRVEKNGLPCYLVFSLLEMSNFGGGGADALKLGVDTVFNSEEAMVKLSEEQYTNKMVSATSDGASVNTGKYNGFLTQLSETREWLISVHCSNHHTELAFKSAILRSGLKIVEDAYIAIYFLHKNTSVRAVCTVLGITSHIKLPKIHGTRFINHRRKGLKVFFGNMAWSQNSL